MTSAARHRSVIGRTAAGQPRTYRLAQPAREAAYRRLAIAILGLDVRTLTSELQSARRALGRGTGSPGSALARAA
jgi:hypothetical protein